MAKFRYIGDPRDHHRAEKRHDVADRQTTAFGHDFVLDGKPVEVSDEHAINKLRGNTHFTEVVAKKKAPAKKKAAAKPKDKAKKK